MTEQQPMKMAAAEALWETETKAGLSLFAIGDVDEGRNRFDVQVPRLLSFMATNTFDGEVRGMNDLQREYEQTYGPGDYKPIPWVTYWTFRLMIGFGMLAGLVSLLWLWASRRGRAPRAGCCARPPCGRCPCRSSPTRWAGSSPRWAAALDRLRRPAHLRQRLTDDRRLAGGDVPVDVRLLYTVLAVISVRLVVKYVRLGLPDVTPAQDAHDDSEQRPLAFSY
jgi:cytochrome d ubiquinol oxidase subunit I